MSFNQSTRLYELDGIVSFDNNRTGLRVGWVYRNQKSQRSRYVSICVDSLCRDVADTLPVTAICETRNIYLRTRLLLQPREVFRFQDGFAIVLSYLALGSLEHSLFEERSFFIEKAKTVAVQILLNLEVYFEVEHTVYVTFWHMGYTTAVDL